jgi:hypothetical protein
MQHLLARQHILAGMAVRRSTRAAAATAAAGAKGIASAGGNVGAGGAAAAAPMRNASSSSRKTQPARATTTTGTAPPLPPPPLHHVKNFRDLATHTSGRIKPGLIYRCAGPIHANDGDAALLFGALKIREMLDLRSRDELEREGCAGSPAFRGASFCAYSRDPVTRRSLPDPRATTMVDAWAWPGGEEARTKAADKALALGAGARKRRGGAGGRGEASAAAAEAADPHNDNNPKSDDDGRLMRRHIPLLQKRRYVRALLKRMPLSEAARVAALLVVDRRRAMEAVLSVVNAGGLEQLYEVTLEEAGPELAACCHAALQALERNRPVLFFCRVGKDRTGILAALLLLCCGVPQDDVLDDYHASDSFHGVGLAGLEKEPGLVALDKKVFERAPREAMEYGLAFLSRITAGGGAPAYLEQHGFGREAQRRLRELIVVAEDGGGVVEEAGAGGGKRARV